ncbi:precorrin-3B synthase [Rhizobium skierniewicense]|uniref:precorrin-3B synthase n=1 Tax=Rhizobium skierniewicense TaxID=984260 RepID=UPI0015749A4A|nr:precorrin-3B synthase [Rhizobium skierniewicense]NTF33336.1 precorrin-3B synthase [Rhizobium skierniewicense]
MSARLLDITPFTRRGVCPALSAPMQTGDGLLSRVAFTDAISATDLERLCALGIRYGNGLIDLTARGGVQFRGLTAGSAAALEVDVLALGLPLRQGLAVETSPLAGMDETAIAETLSIVSRVSETAATLGLDDCLAAKMSVIIDGGGQVEMAELLADIRLKAIRLDDGLFWFLMLGGAQDQSLKAGLLRADDAVDVVIELLSCLAERGRDARGRDLEIETVRRICGDRLIEHAIDVPPARVSSPFGLMRLVDDIHRPSISPLTNHRFAAALAPAFGQMSAEALSALCGHATALGIKNVRPGPAHTLFFIGTEDACQALLARAAELGFVTTADDPRSAIAACTGKPACASAFIATRALAEDAVIEIAGLLDGSLTLHLSGCGKGCAHPTAATLAFSGSSEGLAFSYSGRASGAPDVILPFTEQRVALSRLARLYEKEHKPGENARTLLSRLGRQKIVAALRQEDR